jgi:hypothetical protein
MYARNIAPTIENGISRYSLDEKQVRGFIIRQSMMALTEGDIKYLKTRIQLASAKSGLIPRL